MYPSVTFCTKYIWQDFPGVMEILNNNKSIGYKVIFEEYYNLWRWNKYCVGDYLMLYCVGDEKLVYCVGDGKNIV